MILDELGEEHMRTGSPIVYTSGDSVFQVAAHEEVIPVDELWRICAIARELMRGEHNVGRIIARPFVGPGKGHFKRTANRKDFTVTPTGETVRRARHEIRQAGRRLSARSPTSSTASASARRSAPSRTPTACARPSI